MSVRPGTSAATRLGASVLAGFLAMMAVGAASAHTGSPGTIAVTQTGPLAISVSGTWSWPAMASAGTLSYVGYAVDWGDVSSGNVIGTFHIGDGTPATNVVLQPTTPAQGSSGTWGAVSHTYAKAGTYNVCVIIYDLGTTKPFLTTGYHSLQAGGTGHNTDNSVDHHQQVPALCAVFAATGATPTGQTPTPGQTVAGATSQPTSTPSPFQSLLGATSGPTATPPPTAAADPRDGTDAGLPLLAVALFLGSLFGSILAYKMARLRL
jgi:hypothetical protein